MTKVAPPIPFDAELLSQLPPGVVEFILQLLAANKALSEENLLLREANEKLKARIETLEAKLKLNSSNSNKPPSTDLPFKKKPDTPKKEKKPRKRKGVRQQMLPPMEIIELHPGVRMWVSRPEKRSSLLYPSSD